MGNLSLWDSRYDSNGLILSSRISSEHDVILTGDDFSRAKSLFGAERITPYNPDSVFRGILYCLLTSSTSFKSQHIILAGLESTKLTNPDIIAVSKPTLDSIVTGILYPQKMARNVHDLASQWWPMHGRYVAEQLQEDESRNQGFSIRQVIANTCPGVGYKCASLFMRMNGYLDFVPMDRWALRFLRDVVGEEVSEVNDKKKTILPSFNPKSGTQNYTRGLHPKQHLHYESKFSEFAREKGFAPAALQMVLYAKRTQWNPEQYKRIPLLHS